MAPRVSVIVPTRNRRVALGRALASVEAQSYRDFEVVVADDASTDGTAAWLGERFPGTRVAALDKARGAAAARNSALALARGELVAFLDDDDAWQASYLDAQVAHLDAHPDVDLSFADHIERDAGGNESWPDTRSLLVYPSPLVRLLSESFIHTMSVVVCRRSAFDRAGLFDESLHIVHDLDWYARVLITGGRIAHLPRLLVERAVPGGLVTSHREWFREEGLFLTRTFAAAPAQGQHERLVRAYRSLFFARMGLGKGSLAFGLSRLAEALRVSTAWTIRIAAFRLLRRAHLDWRDVPDGLDTRGGPRWPPSKLPPGLGGAGEARAGTRNITRAALRVQAGDRFPDTLRGNSGSGSVPLPEPPPRTGVAPAESARTTVTRTRSGRVV